MASRNTMVDNSQLFTGYEYQRNELTKKINFDTDVPISFKFEWYNNEGNTTEDEQVLPNRVSAADGAIIQTDYKIARDSIVVIDSARYLVSKVKSIHNSSYDLRALRGGSNVTYIVYLDTSG